MAKKTTNRYTEPSGYFPKSVRKNNQIGEFDKGEAKKKTTGKKSK